MVTDTCRIGTSHPREQAAIELALGAAAAMVVAGLPSAGWKPTTARSLSPHR